MDLLRKLPNWLETGLGKRVYLTTYLATIITGNIGHTLMNLGHMERVLCVGASGGLCGLCGLLYASLARMGNGRAAMDVLMRMFLVFVYGFLSPNVSNAAHIGGFLGGVAIGILFGPSYRQSYAARRKNSLEADPFSRDYRLAMGFGNAPGGGLLPLELLWMAAGVALVLIPSLRTAPLYIVRGLLDPASIA